MVSDTSDPRSVQPASTSKCHEALGIPLVLEQILLNLETEDLLLSVTRVNKAVQTFINESAPLQRKLFFRTCQTSERAEPVFNPYLIDRYIDDLPGSSAIDLPTLYNTDNSDPPTTVPSIGIYLHALTFEQITTAGGSWRHMLIAQSTESYTLDLMIYGQTELNEGWLVLHEAEDFVLESGTTLGSLLDKWVAEFGGWASRRKALCSGKLVQKGRRESKIDV